jgi:hypothetical protein
VNRADRAEVQRYISGGDPEFFEEDFADDDIVDPVQLTPAQAAEIDALVALVPVEPAVPTFYEELS